MTRAHKTQPTPRRPFRRREWGKGKYPERYVLATEGSETEPDYFEMIQDKFGEGFSFFFDFAKSRNIRKPDPVNTLKFMKKELKEKELKRDDEAWIIVDRDEWTEEQIKPLYKWAKKKKNYHVAFSNPCFEVWLLFHFEEWKNYRSSKECKSCLKSYLPECDKKNMKNKIELEHIHKAIERASLRWKVSSAPPHWPGEAGVTTVHELMEKLLPPPPS